MTTCIECGKDMDNKSNLSSICTDCAGKLADDLSPAELVAMAKVGLDALIDEVTGYEKVRPKGELKERHEKYVEGYFSSPGNALKALVNLEVKATELKDLQTVVDRIDKVEAMIEKALKEV